jgi:hypothetical protein
VTKRGFIKVSADLYLALSAARIGRYERVLIDLVVTESREPDGATPLRLRPSEIADRFGYSRNRVSEAKAALVARRFLINSAEGYTLNRSPGEWLDAAGDPCLSPREMEIYGEIASRIR